MDTLEPQFDLIAGNLCLDFANTVGGLPPDSPSQERITSYSELVVWSWQTGLLSEQEACLLLHKAELVPLESAAILERARTLREGIRRIFRAVVQGEYPDANDLNLLNSELDRAMAGARVVESEGRFELEWPMTEGVLDQMLAPIVRSGATLLTSADRRFFGQCANEDFRWLFVDTTNNHTRRWCRTNGCGNVMRVRKHREQQRSNEK